MGKYLINDFLKLFFDKTLTKNTLNKNIIKRTCCNMV